MINNVNRCDTCNHKAMPKIITTGTCDSPCFACIFNVHIPKTNNYMCEVIQIAGRQINKQKTIDTANDYDY